MARWQEGEPAVFGSALFLLWLGGVALLGPSILELRQLIKTKWNSKRRLFLLIMRPNNETKVLQQNKNERAVLSFVVNYLVECVVPSQPLPPRRRPCQGGRVGATLFGVALKVADATGQLALLRWALLHVTLLLSLIHI